MGMADGRCLSSFDSTNIVNDIIMQKNGIAYQDNYAYRQFLQNNGPEALNLPLQNAACHAGKISPLVDNE